MPERDATHWTRYNAQQTARRARPLLIDALNYAGPGHDRLAIDLGCGAGIETQLLLSTGWTVHALDADEPSLRQLQSSIRPPASSRLTTRVVDLNDLPELAAADLIYAGYGLPFARPDCFHAMWSTMTRALAPEAILAVSLFGDHDSWAHRAQETHLTEVQARELLDGLETLQFRVEDEDGPAFSGPKHWHVFHIIARQPATTPRRIFA